MAATPTENDRSLTTVMARMTAKPGKEDELRKGLEALIDTTLAEDGCVNYDLHVAQDDPASFFFYENWTSRDKLDAHLAAPHLVDFAGKLDDLLVGGADGLVVVPVTRIA